MDKSPFLPIFSCAELSPHLVSTTNSSLQESLHPNSFDTVVPYNDCHGKNTFPIPHWSLLSDKESAWDPRKCILNEMRAPNLKYLEVVQLPS